MAKHEPAWREVFRNEFANYVEYECSSCYRTTKVSIYPPQMPSLADH